ncbi:MAG: hypothetical protein M1820_003609 [Bogoriella megaspora]|nr:MAG: hypothetical protein M1820_003609 [Bogoriella megaspora]
MLNAVGAIRLMILRPAKADHERIRCKLANESLENSFDFEALSYVWGDSSDRRVIEVDGVDFTITSNLDTALRHLRYHDSKPRVLWVDAVCIDQSNHAERSFQVRQMRGIFSKAREVIIWLGPESRTTAQAFNTITRNIKKFDKFLDEVPEPPDHSLPGGVSTQPRDLKRVALGYSTPSGRFPFLFNSGEVDAIIKLLNRPWFRRIWVIQEIAFAATATVYCGKVRFRWDDIAFATGLIRDSLFNRPTPTELIGLSIEKENGLRASLMFFALVQRRCGQPYGLNRLLSTFSTFQMTDPRDRVYAVLGLSADFCSGKSPLSVLQPDYSLSLQQVFTYTARAIIEHERNLDCLMSVTQIGRQSQKGTGFSELPTWVPDWMSCRVYQDFRNPRLLEDSPILVRDNRGDHKFNCCLNLEQQRPPTFKFLADGRILGVLGIHADRIIAAAPLEIEFWTNPNNDRQSPSKWTRDYMLAFLGVDSTLHCVQSLRKTFWLTYIIEWTEKMEALERKLTNSTAPISMTQVLSRLRNGNAYQFLDRKVPGVTEIPPSNHAEEEALVDYLDSSLKQMMTSAPSIHVSFSYLPQLLHMFRTSKGYFGLGPLQACEGDIIVVLLGGKMPFVLRKVLDYYWLLGQCKVDGIMNGEIIQQQQAGEYEFEEFLII